MQDLVVDQGLRDRIEGGRLCDILLQDLQLGM
jgi:hypothetical protein